MTLNTLITRCCKHLWYDEYSSQSITYTRYYRFVPKSMRSKIRFLYKNVKYLKTFEQRCILELFIVKKFCFRESIANARMSYHTTWPEESASPRKNHQWIASLYQEKPITMIQSQNRKKIEFDSRKNRKNDPPWIETMRGWKNTPWLDAKGRARFVERTQMRRGCAERARYRKAQRAESRYFEISIELLRSESVLAAAVSTSRRFSPSEAEKKAALRVAVLIFPIAVKTSNFFIPRHVLPLRPIFHAVSNLRENISP